MGISDTHESKSVLKCLYIVKVLVLGRSAWYTSDKKGSTNYKLELCSLKMDLISIATRKHKFWGACWYGGLGRLRKSHFCSRRVFRPLVAYLQHLTEIEEHRLPK